MSEETKDPGWKTVSPLFEKPRTMFEVGVEGDRFNPHPENSNCATSGCVPEPQAAKSQMSDVIGGFPDISPDCKGCNRPLTVENAWMTDGCPCNSGLGVNSMNETRWRLLMELQQRQSRELEAARSAEREDM